MTVMEKTMNLSKEAQDILSNFASISQSINFEPGNIIKIRNESNSFYAVTEVQETFPKEFCIYDLSKFLQALKLFPSTDIEFDEATMIIKNTNGSGKVHYSYTNPALIKTIDYSKNPKFSESLLEFTLTSDTFKQLQKAAAMFGVQNIVIKSSDNNNIELITTTVDKNKKDTDNLFSVEVPSEKYSEDIAVAVDKDILKLYNGDYKVIVYPVNAKQSMLYFKNISVSNTLEYIASAKIV